MTSPIATRAFAIVPSDTAVLPGATNCGIYISTAGTLQVTMSSGKIVNFGTVAVGLLPICAIQVWNTGTGASNMVGLQS